MEITESSLFALPSMREGQKEFYLDARKAADNGLVLLANAPTGIGKTAAALCAALESAIPAGRRVLFLTNRSSHHLQAVEEITRINGKRKEAVAKLRGNSPESEATGERILLVDKIAKERMCLHRMRNPRESGPLRCEMSRAFCSYSRPKEGDVLDVLEAGLAASGTNSLCSEKSACPHFAALAAMKGADVVIADYRYLFDEGVRNVFFQSSGFCLEKTDVIIDEAHNLPDAVREINSPSIDQDSCRLAAQGLQLARKLAKKQGEAAVAESFAAPHAYLRDTLSGLVDEAGLSGREEDSALGKAEISVFGKEHYGRSTLASGGRSIAGELLRAAAFVRDCVTKEGQAEEFSAEGVKRMEELAQFLSTASAVADGGRSAGLFARSLGEGNYIIKAVLFDASEISRGIFAGMHSAVLMSGTLVGKRALVDLLGIDEARVLGMEESAYQSAFPPVKNPVAICTAASSRMRERAEGGSSGMMARAIAEAARGCLPHSAAVFYPSYDYMAMITKKLDLPEFLQESEMRSSAGKAGERKARIESGVGGAPVLFHAVIGGSFSEGVDFKKNPFKLIIVAGFPHPKSGGPHAAYESYLAWKFGSQEKAVLYASIYPAIIRSVQALGRGIRSETDWCYGILIDDRFERYRALLPPGIRARARMLPPSAMGRDVAEFSGRAGKA